MDGSSPATLRISAIYKWPKLLSDRYPIYVPDLLIEVGIVCHGFLAVSANHGHAFVNLSSVLRTTRVLDPALIAPPILRLIFPIALQS